MRRKPKISDQYDKDSYIKGYKKGWGDCLAAGLYAIRNCSITSDQEFIDAVLEQHPYRSYTETVRGVACEGHGEGANPSPSHPLHRKVNE